jgi:hypothetical protein
VKALRDSFAYNESPLGELLQDDKPPRKKRASAK